jgi:hypothetical protein
VNDSAETVSPADGEAFDPVGFKGLRSGLQGCGGLAQAAANGSSSGTIHGDLRCPVLVIETSMITPDHSDSVAVTVW